jgi:hypothetical protein
MKETKRRILVTEQIRAMPSHSVGSQNKSKNVTIPRQRNARIPTPLTISEIQSERNRILRSSSSFLSPTFPWFLSRHYSFYVMFFFGGVIPILSFEPRHLAGRCPFHITEDIQDVSRVGQRE